MPRSELFFAFEEGVFDKSSAKLSLTDVSNHIDYGIFFSDLCVQFFDPIFSDFRSFIFCVWVPTRTNNANF